MRSGKAWLARQKMSREFNGPAWFGGAGEGTRTPDPIITNDVLYQLSYTGPAARREGRDACAPAGAQPQ